MNIKVSVVIPTYKRKPEILARAVESVRSQTYKNIEIIVVDDNAANPEFREKIREYVDAIGDERVKYVANEKNLGGALSRNEGIYVARGEYITFLDDDDEYLPDKIETQLNFMLSNDSDLSFEDLIMYDKNNHVVDVRQFKDIKSFDNDYLLRYHLCRHMTGTSTFMYKADKLREIGGFDDAKMGQEFFLMLKSIERGLKISYLPECHMKMYRHEEGGISQGNNKITGEINVFNQKKKYFNLLSFKERTYIRLRHRLIMVVAYKRNHMHGKMLLALIAAFFTSPLGFVKEGASFVGRIVRCKGK